MKNNNLGKNQLKIVMDFLTCKEKIDDFKQALLTWKSNADFAIANVTNPYNYGIKFTDSPCKYFALLPNTPFFNYYIFDRFMSVAMQTTNEQPKLICESYKIEFEQNAPIYENEKKVVADFLIGLTTFNEYKKQIMSFKHFKAFLNQKNCFEINGKLTKYDLTILDIETYEDLYLYHMCLYNLAVNIGMELMPTKKYLYINNEINKRTMQYAFEAKNLKEVIEKYIYKNIDLTDKKTFIQREEQIANCLPKVVKTNAGFYNIPDFVWPTTKEGKPFDLIDFKQHNEEYIYIFNDVQTNCKKEIRYTNQDEKNTLKQPTWSETLLLIKRYAEGEADLFSKVLQGLIDGKKLHQYENTIKQIDYHNIKNNNYENRLTLFDYCQKILKSEKISNLPSDEYRINFLKNRNKNEKYKVFVDFVEGFLTVCEYVSKLKKLQNFKEILSPNKSGQVSRINEKQFNYILSKKHFNAFDELSLFNLTRECLSLKGIPHYVDYSHCDNYIRNQYYCLNYAEDSIMYDYIEKFLTECAESKTKKEKEKYVKDKLKNLYTFENSFPVWNYYPNWQYDLKNEPLHYLYAKILTPYTIHKMYYFKNKKTNEIVTYEQKI